MERKNGASFLIAIFAALFTLITMEALRFSGFKTFIEQSQVFGWIGPRHRMTVVKFLIAFSLFAIGMLLVWVSERKSKAGEKK